MKSLLTSSIAATIAVVVTALVFASLVNSRIDRESGLREHLTARLLVLHEEIADINHRLDQLDHTRANLDRIDNRPALKMADEEGTQRGIDDETLRELIRDLIEEDRTARFATTRETQWKRLREWQDNRKGPYGEFNSRVNAMTRILDLDYTQASYYYTLLTEYNQQANLLYAGISGRVTGQGTDPVIFQSVLDSADMEKRGLDATFDQAFIQTLTPEQASRYEQLPPEERGVGPNAGLSQVEFKLSDLHELAANEE